MERRLSAILVADMVGYSRLIEADETGTLVRQKRHRTELIDPAFAQHQGRIIKTTGDGLLAEFPSVVEAVACAVAIQRDMAVREADMPDNRRIAYRIGINLGDVIHEDGDLQGDGVNVAARLEQMADPGGICISGTAYDQLRSTVDAGYEDLGEVQVKNIARPIRVWRVLLDAERAGDIVAAPRTTRRSWVVPVLGTAAFWAAGGLSLWWWLVQPEFTPADPARYAFELPDTPSIAVLAFDNLSGDAANDYLGEGLSENIIATLAGEPKLFVIARNSSFHYQGTATQVQAIAEELGVRYVLEGSVQLSGDTIRVTAQLIDALDGRHLWSNTYDRTLSTSGLFEIQDDITKDILQSVGVELIFGNQAQAMFKETDDLKTIQLMNQAMAEFQKFTPEANQRSEDLLLQALERSPRSSVVYVNLGWATWYKIPLGRADDPQVTFAKAREYGNRSAELDPNSPYAYAFLAWLDMYSLDYEAAIANAERAVELSPTGGIGTSVAGWVISCSGNPARGAELLRLGMRTEPFYPDWIPFSLANSLMMLGEYDEAAELLDALIDQAGPTIRVWATNSRAALAVWQDDIDLARRLISERLIANPQSSVELSRRYWYQLKDEAYLERFLEALRVAGLPEHPPG